MLQEGLIIVLSHVCRAHSIRYQKQLTPMMSRSTFVSTPLSFLTCTTLIAPENSNDGRQSNAQAHARKHEDAIDVKVETAFDVRLP